MKEYAKKFYKSKAWVKCRNAYFNSQNGICELCGKIGEEVHHKQYLTAENIHDVNITLAWENLQLLCRTCHCEIHKKQYAMYRARTRKDKGVINGLCFNEDGELVENKNVFIIWGAPASGKTTYVKDNKGEYDIVVDLDHIMAALSLGKGKSFSDDALPFALEVRDSLYSMIQERKYFFEKVWVVACLPMKSEREELARRLRGQLIHIDTIEEKCMLNAKRDEERRNKDLQYRIIKEYFEKLEV